MLFRVGVRGAAGITAALVFLGANVEWNSVKAVPVSNPEKVAEMCAKVTADTYGYCCKLRLEPTCTATSSKPVRQSVPLKVAEARDNEDIGAEGVTSVFVNGNTEDPGRGLAANNGGASGNGGNGGANGGGEHDGGETDGEGPL